MTVVNLNDNVLPLTPNAVTGSPTPMPLVNTEQYQEVTNDLVTPLARLQSLIDEAVEDLSHECRRTFTYGQYTESQFLYPNGMVYPSATPMDVNQPVVSGTQIYNPATDNTGSSIIQGDGVWVGWFTPLPWMPFYTGVVPPQTVLTYWGGFVNPILATTPQTRPHALPSRLKRIICTIVYYRANPVVLQGTPAGVRSMSVGGVSISGDLSSLMDRDADLRRAICRWRHPQAQPWQS